MKNKLLYFGLLVVTLYLAILYDSPMLLGFGLMEMVLPVISGILMLWTAAHMKAQIYLPIGVAEKEQPVNVGGCGSKIKAGSLYPGWKQK